MSELVSIIIPIYNVEKYIDRCIYSVVNQTYENIEIILVDDGSIDQSSIFCDKWIKSDSRILLIKKNNGGLSDARNAGLEMASGKYICFVDSDDWIEPETIEIAERRIHDVDLVVWGYYSDFVDQNERMISSDVHKYNALCKRNLDYKKIIDPEVMGIAGYAWNKLYKKNLIDNLRFEKGISLVEDVLFNVPYMCKCEIIAFIDYIGTHYMQRDISTLGKIYYPDYLKLKIWCTEFKKKLLLSYGASESVTHSFLGTEYIAILRSYIRIISNQNWTYGIRRRTCLNILRSEEANEILDNIQPRSITDRVVHALSKYRFVDLLLFLSRKHRR